MKGTVKFFDSEKNYGFIKGEDDTDYFVHSSGLEEGVEINENDAVLFETEQAEKGPKAISVTLDK
jgi:CspA family cold shock protein